MFSKPASSFDAWTKPTKAAFDFWVSFWPVAPAFGVEWRFADAMPRFTPRILETGLEHPEPEAPANTPVKSKTTKPKPRAVQAHPAPAVEIVEAVEAAMAPVDAMVEAAMESVEVMIDAISAPEPDADAAEPVAPGRPAGLLDAAPAAADDLKLIKGIGPALERQLNDLGVYRFDQMAAFSDDDLAWIDANLTAFKGRCFRDDWVGQARAHLA